MYYRTNVLTLIFSYLCSREEEAKESSTRSCMHNFFTSLRVLERSRGSNSSGSSSSSRSSNNSGGSSSSSNNSSSGSNSDHNNRDLRVPRLTLTRLASPSDLTATPSGPCLHSPPPSYDQVCLCTQISLANILSQYNSKMNANSTSRFLSLPTSPLPLPAAV